MMSDDNAMYTHLHDAVFRHSISSIPDLAPAHRKAAVESPLDWGPINSVLPTKSAFTTRFINMTAWWEVE